MNVHKNARLMPRGRERIVRHVESGQTPEAIAQAAGVCPRTKKPTGSLFDAPLGERNSCRGAPSAALNQLGTR
jgi:hypothetical protein